VPCSEERRGHGRRAPRRARLAAARFGPSRWSPDSRLVGAAGQPHAFVSRSPFPGSGSAAAGFSRKPLSGSPGPQLAHHGLSPRRAPCGTGHCASAPQPRHAAAGGAQATRRSSSCLSSGGLGFQVAHRERRRGRPGDWREEKRCVALLPVLPWQWCHALSPRPTRGPRGGCGEQRGLRAGARWQRDPGGPGGLLQTVRGCQGEEGCELAPGPRGEGVAHPPSALHGGLRGRGSGFPKEPARGALSPAAELPKRERGVQSGKQDRGE